MIKLRRMSWAGRVAHMGDRSGVHGVLVGKPEGKRPVGRHRRRWDVNIKVGVQEVGWSCVDSIDLAQDRNRWRALVNAIINLLIRNMRGIS
jgi:hypothetical protein